MKRSTWILTGSAAIVAVSSVPFQLFTCCGTQPGLGTALQLLVVSYAHYIVYCLSSTEYADTHSWQVFVIAILINTLVFLIPALIVLLFTRSRAPRLGVILQLCWLIFYLGAEFVLFPAQEGS